MTHQTSNNGTPPHGSADKTNTVTDPVCGMTISATTAVGTSTFRGETYYFCSAQCKTKFDGDPVQYARPANAGDASHE